MTSYHYHRHSEQLEAYRHYMQLLLASTNYYCTSLFFFIRFDPIKLEINTTGTRVSFQEVADARSSRYSSEYGERGAFIEVKKVVKDKEGEFTFSVKRDRLQLTQKTT